MSIGKCLPDKRRQRYQGKRNSAWSVLGDRLHQSQTRQIWLWILAGLFRYLSRLDGGIPNQTQDCVCSSQKFLEEILPRFGVPHMIGSDNGPTFISQVSQGIATALWTEWKLHCAYRLKSSGQNSTLKKTFTKLALKTSRDWLAFLPYALVRARNTSYRLGLTPFEIMHGHPCPLILSSCFSISSWCCNVFKILNILTFPLSQVPWAINLGSPRVKQRLPTFLL